MEMSICFATNDRYAPHAATLITSIMENKSSEDELSFHFFSDQTTLAIQNVFREMSQKLDFQLTIYEISDDQFADLPVFAGSRTAYFRLAMHRMLPKSLNKILYLDCDMIVMTSLKELYTVNISGYYAAVVASALRVPHLSVDYPYFNSGMILFNLEKYRNENMENHAIQFGCEHHGLLWCADQEILNYIFKGNVVYMPLKWNMMLYKERFEAHWLWGFEKYPYTDEELHEAETSPSIIHYVTVRKPWLADSDHPHREIYWEYARKAPFYEQILHDYNKIKPKLFSKFETLEVPFASFVNYAYGTKSMEQKMDIYLPANKGEINVFLLIHGGSWIGGDKTDYTSLCMRILSKGLCCATMNYRMLKPNVMLDRQPVNYSGMLDDIDNAIVSLKSKLTIEGYSPHKLVLFGASSGGHLALLYGYSRYEQSAIPIAFLVQELGYSDFTDIADFKLYQQRMLLPQLSLLAGQAIDYEDVLNKAEMLKDMSPLYHVKPSVPPTLMRYDTRGELMPLSQGTKLKAALDLAGVRNDLFVYLNYDHGQISQEDSIIRNAYHAKYQEYMDTFL